MALERVAEGEARLDVLKREGYIRGYHLVEKPGAFPEFEIELKYFDGAPVIVEISRVSKPGRRVYASVESLPVVYRGLAPDTFTDSADASSVR